MLETFPHIAAEADGWDPATVSAGSNARLRWLCSKGHDWEAQVDSRTGQNQGCPYCGGKRAWPGFNDLATVRPDIAARAFDFDPSEVTAGSNKVKNWKCDLGHVWKAPIKALVVGQGCAVCAGQQVQIGVNDLRTLFPKIAAELVDPDDFIVTAGSNRRLKWRCSELHEWEEAVNRRTRRGDGCPICSGHRLLAGYNDVATKNPEVAKEADGWDPSTVYYRSDVKYPWVCSAGHKWMRSAEQRAHLGAGCPVCSNTEIVAGVNDLATTHPDIAAQACGWDPTSMGAGSAHKPMLWECSLGHKWRSAIYTRTSVPNGCPYCGRKKLLTGFNDLATTHPELLPEVDGWDPTQVMAGTAKRLSWKCAFGHRWISQGTSRTHRGSGCPVCSGNVVEKGFNDLATTHPELVSAAVDWDPTTVSKGHQGKKAWRCELGHVWKAPPSSITQGGWCPYCAGKAVLKGFNDLQTTHPLIAAEAYGWDPTTIVRGHAKKKLWRCVEGHEWRATPANRTNQNQGCPSCSKSGFDPNKDGYLYFLEHHEWEMLQVGITNVPKDRLRTHEKLGWTVLNVRGPMDGQLTRDLEGAALRALERRGAVFANKTDVRNFTGWSEAWTKRSFPVATLAELIDLVYEDDDIIEPRRGRGRRGDDIDGRSLPPRT